MPKTQVKKSRPRQSRMDFFLSSSPSKKSAPKPQGSSSNGPRQVTIQSLSRVVNVDHIVRCKTILKDPKTNKEAMLATLEELLEKIPSREVLQSTKIGFVVRKLVKNEDKDIAKLSKEIYHKWKNFFVDQATKESVDVKCSSSTETCRRNVRRHLASTLDLEIDDAIVVNFEREAFQLCKTLTLNQYKRILRSIILKSRQDSVLRQSILDKTKTTANIVDMFK